MPTLTYHDAYLSPYADDAVEARAFDYVDQLDTFDAVWRDQLAVLRAYLLICMDKQAEPEDLFTAKLKTYRREFESTLAQARSAAAAVTGESPALFSVPLLRG